MENIIDIFDERGFIEQVTDRDLLAGQLNRPTTCYIGFDPTARSLHAGSLLPIMSLVHMQRVGHRPIVLIGGGTALIGDPSGKTEMRPIMDRKEINENAECIKKQLSRFIDFSNGKAIMVNNADWLTGLGYIDFLRDIGRHFSVNRMLTAESYKARLETGLNFIEFNYMLLQSYDFWYLFKHHDCRLQIGGNDQWGNIIAGADLTRRLEQEIVHGLTLPLLTTSAGIKMGKTHKGAVWLDPELTSPYHYYQYWINQDDRDVERFLALFTLIPMDEVRRLGALDGADIREAKAVLAYEATMLCHGKEAADRARAESMSFFSAGLPQEASETGSDDHGPSYNITRGRLEQGIPAYVLFEMAGLCGTRSEARRLISQGGGYLNGDRIQVFDQMISTENLNGNAILLRAGKKRYTRILMGD
ncbi:Tyrosine--tRNA ligase [uncultured Desulfobacterium sp.]|uniref:Tyrosine--tRNA ligase n=1 Tax=uncultured Desulfobacterium sp. TaxID=201089 RepID=A0A445MWT6_9BACT|nr:Tyrosine--tRNA ligase [uncultured Desulfobacterium sp.]